MQYSETVQRQYKFVGYLESEIYKLSYDDVFKKFRYNQVSSY